MSVQNLECYLYELAQCFEGYAKATLLLLLLGLTAVIAMLYSIMNKLAVQQRGAASTISFAELSSLADTEGEETTTSESEKEAKPKNTKNKKKKNNDEGRQEMTTSECKEKAKHKREEENKLTTREGRTGKSEKNAKYKKTKKTKSEKENNDISGEETTTGESKEEAKTKKLQRKNGKNTKLDDSDEHVEQSNKSDKDESKEDNESNAGKTEDVSIYAKKSLHSTHDKVFDEIPCGLTIPPCDCKRGVLRDHKRTQCQAMKICHNGGITKSPLSSRTSLICTPSNCSFNSKNCLSHVPECTSNSQLYTCRKFKRKSSCCSDCCEH